ncbi:MAG TPA: serine/threonine-protein kinase, partial [Polyangiaceae bacterium]
GDFAEVLGARADSPTSPLRAIAERGRRRLERQDDETDVVMLVGRALEAYETRGARAAFEIAQRAAALLGRSMDLIALNEATQEHAGARVLGALHDLDLAALERPRLRELLLLGRRPGDTDAAVPELDQLYDRLGRWILHIETAEPQPATPSAALAEQHRLRTLLHLMDADGTRNEDDKKVRARVAATIRLLLGRIATRPASASGRIACATLARAFDAAIRENLAEPADLLLALAGTVHEATTYRSIGEASTNPDVRGVVTAYAEFLRGDAHESSEPLTENTASEGLRFSAIEEASRVAGRVVRLSRGLGAGGSYRGEALRRIVLRVGRALEAVAGARGQNELVDSASGGSEVLGELEGALEDLQRLARGAARRLQGEDVSSITVAVDAPTVASLVERSARSGIEPDPDSLQMAVSALTADAPQAIGEAVALVLARLATLPASAQSDVFAIPLERRRVQLPDWLLPHRTIGSFYVSRSLGRGGASSVFLARRLEERSNPKAEGFALKVPDYDPTTARSLSEQQFLDLFREEAGALLSLPPHENLARFVTFDTGARPKPILVMELIRGASLDRLIHSGSLSTERVLAYLDGILAGLDAMHRAGVAHLDVKPSNVILRNGQVPVLVDFGLSGRHLRPGCGTLEYCAPEVLGTAPADWEPCPTPTDVYAFACTAFEALTATLLFEGDDESAMIDAHVAHDGWPAGLASYAHTPQTAELAKLLAACLRRDPRNRPTTSQARNALGRLRTSLSSLEWPLRPRHAKQLAAG